VKDEKEMLSGINFFKIIIIEKGRLFLKLRFKGLISGERSTIVKTSGNFRN
jgi:hypothetical protein